MIFSLKLAFTSFILAFSTMSVSAQTYKYEWVKPFKGLGIQRTIAVATNAANNVYALGYFSNSAEFVASNSATTLNCYGSTDVFLLKMSASGQMQWYTHMGFSGNAHGFAIWVDDSSNVYITGLFDDVIDLDPSNLTDFFLTSNSKSDNGFVAKYDSTGAFIWGYQIGGNDDSWGNSVTVDDSSNVYVSGFYAGTVDFNTGPGVASHTANGYADAFILKLSSNGSFRWVYAFGGTFDDRIVELAISQTNEIYATGAFRKVVNFNPYGSGGLDSTQIGEAAFILKLNSQGNFIWLKTIKSTSTVQAGHMDLDATGNLIVVGTFTGTADFDPSSATQFLSSPSNYNTDTWLSKYSPQGALVWIKQLDAHYVSESYVGDDGHIYTSGLFTGSVDLVPGPYNFIVTSRGNTDVFMVRQDASGNVVWGNAFGGTDAENAWGLTVDGDGSFYVCGDFKGTANFSTLTDPKTAWALQEEDAYVVKYSVNGNIGTDEFLANEIDLRLTPNPNNGMFSITLPEYLREAEIHVYTMLGRQIATKNTQTDFGFEIELEGASGIYLLHIVTPQQTIVKRFVKQ